MNLLEVANCFSLLTQHINLRDHLGLSVSVLCYTLVVPALISTDPVVKEEEVVCGHRLVIEVPEVVGLGVGLSRTEDLV